MKETILKLRTMLPAQEFIMTGSYVLTQYGLMSSYDDLDIILIKPEPATVETINRFMKDFPAKTTAKFQAIPVPLKTDEHEYDKPAKHQVQATKKPTMSAIFMFDSVKVDIFIEDNLNEPVLIIDGIKCTTIPHIIEAKRKYGRMKDWMQLRDMANTFFDQGTFNGLLQNGNWRSLLREDY